MRKFTRVLLFLQSQSHPAPREALKIIRATTNARRLYPGTDDYSYRVTLVTTYRLHGSPKQHIVHTASGPTCDEANQAVSRAAYRWREAMRRTARGGE